MPNRGHVAMERNRQANILYINSHNGERAEVQTITEN